MSIQIFDGLTATRLRRLPGAATCRSLAVRGETVAAAFGPNVRIWTDEGRTTVHPGAERLAFRDDGRLVGLTRDGYWHRAIGDPDATRTLVEGVVRAALSPRGERVAIHHGGTQVAIHDPMTGMPVQHVTLPSEPLALAVADDGRLVSVDGSGAVRLDSETVCQLTAGLRGLAVSPDGRRVLLVEADPQETLRILHLADEGRPPTVLRQAGVLACFDGDGSHVIAGGPYAHQIRVYDADTGALKSRLRTGSTLLIMVETDWRSDALTGVGTGGVAVPRFDLGAAGTAALLAICLPLLLWMTAFGYHRISRPLPEQSALRTISGPVQQSDIDGSESSTVTWTIGGQQVTLDGPFMALSAINDELVSAGEGTFHVAEERLLFGGTATTVWRIEAPGAGILLTYEQASQWRTRRSRMGWLALIAGLLMTFGLLRGGVPHLQRELGSRPFGEVVDEPPPPAPEDDIPVLTAAPDPDQPPTT